MPKFHRTNLETVTIRRDLEERNCHSNTVQRQAVISLASQVCNLTWFEVKFQIEILIEKLNTGLTISCVCLH